MSNVHVKRLFQHLVILFLASEVHDEFFHALSMILYTLTHRGMFLKLSFIYYAGN